MISRYWVSLEIRFHVVVTGMTFYTNTAIKISKKYLITQVLLATYMFCCY